ncbi:MAG TPA: c-type cytochrome [Chitinophagaceae bacterium]|nr:c-type cytochrome [Chitinophagaceae bacterium]HQV86771.1 c-type cytochrome [Chitinophagaceae bacterium]HQX73047.1 c-type cytochrome [Chitinophagaceae bacterium]HQZ73387.1 c-type cytochrome [Chitinophagaceae bacterium]
MYSNKIKVITGLSIFVLLGVAAVQAPHQKEKNLKILPKDISDEKLDSIMQTYNKALGVKCDFCHVKQKVFPGDFDYASDAEPMKENAREMMRMTIEINKSNFYFDKNIRPEYLNTVTCKTCHRGEPFPPED